MRLIKLSQRHCQRPGRAVIASLLGGLVLLLNALAASPTLHEYFHADASHADHQCAVTLFAHGQVDAAVVAVATPAPVLPAEFFPQFASSLLPALAELLPPGRAPPSSSVNS